MTTQTTTATREPLTTDQLREATGAGECPRCHGQTAEYDSSEYDGDSSWQDARCGGCGTSWREVMGLTYVVEIDDKGEEIGAGAPLGAAADLAGIREIAHELYDAYRAFYGDDESEMVDAERDMLTRARAVLGITREDGYADSES